MVDGLKILAGAFVVHNALEPGIYVGCPAKLLRENPKLFTS